MLAGISTEPVENRGLGKLQTNVAAGRTHIASDLNMLRRAVREGWAIDPEKKPDIIDRLIGITNKTGATVMTKDGPVCIDAVADTNSISAARVLVAMAGQNQADRHHDDKMQLDTARFALDATQALAQLGDTDRRALIEQAGLSHLLPPALAQVSPLSAPAITPVQTPPQPKP